MKKMMKFLGVIAIVAVIGFSMSACGEGEDTSIPSIANGYTITDLAEYDLGTVTLPASETEALEMYKKIIDNMSEANFLDPAQNVNSSNSMARATYNLTINFADYGYIFVKYGISGLSGTQLINYTEGKSTDTMIVNFNCSYKYDSNNNTYLTSFKPARIQAKCKEEGNISVTSKNTYPYDETNMFMKMACSYAIAYTDGSKGAKFVYSFGIVATLNYEHFSETVKVYDNSGTLLFTLEL